MSSHASVELGNRAQKVSGIWCFCLQECDLRHRWSSNHRAKVGDACRLSTQPAAALPSGLAGGSTSFLQRQLARWCGLLLGGILWAGILWIFPHTDVTAEQANVKIPACGCMWSSLQSSYDCDLARLVSSLEGNSVHQTVQIAFTSGRLSSSLTLLAWVCSRSFHTEFCLMFNWISPHME